jgi:hypothetical protein
MRRVLLIALVTSLLVAGLLIFTGHRFSLAPEDPPSPSSDSGVEYIDRVNTGQIGCVFLETC